MKGLTDPMVGLLMGQTAENLAHRFGITRAADGRILGAAATRKCVQAQEAATSRRAAAKSRRSTTRKGNTYPLDDGVRARCVDGEPERS